MIQEIDPAPRRHVDIDPETGSARSSTACTPPRRSRAERRTRSSAASPSTIAGKTGTAERGLTVEDQSWYVALAPYPDPKIVVAATVEQGGFGVDSAAPAGARSSASTSTSSRRRVEQVADPTHGGVRMIGAPARCTGPRRPRAAPARSPAARLTRAHSQNRETGFFERSFFGLDLLLLGAASR